VLLVTIDTLRADRLAAFGGAPGLTPNLDRLASHGIRFTSAITAAPWTLPAIASVLTGLTPDEHGAGRSLDAFDVLARSPLPATTWTLTSALSRCGFLTQAFVTNPYLSMRYGVGNGFDRFENVSMESEAFVAFADTTAVRLVQALAPRLVIGDIGQTVTDRALPWLARHHDERFFLWVHYVDAHAPYGDPRVLGNKSFRGDTVAAALTEQQAQLTQRFDAVARLRSGEIRLTPDQRRQLIHLYDTSVAYDDEQVGQLLDALDRLELSDHTVVIVVGDHGEEFWDHGGVEHGHTLYEELIRVPLIIRWPGGPTQRQVESVVRLTDIAPTVVDVTGCRVDMPVIDGRSLRPLMEAEADDPRTAFSEGMLFSDEKHALRTSQFKYVRWANGKEELFDLLEDPRELRDLASRDGTVEEFRRQMDDHLRRGSNTLTSRPLR
jgi:arylsulfatase A-like enzyme